ncbi:MAG TPA: glycosyltransferase family 4 protein [Ignavibacteriales bacterium]|nr:glycosyltransferase family 4 protein [Ignavibacteriales bacterium]
MKIVHTISSFSSGGAEALIRELSYQQIQTSEVEIWAMNPSHNPEYSHKIEAELKDAGIKTAVAGDRPNSERFKKLSFLRDLLKERKPDVVNAHSEVHAAFIATASIGLGINLFQTIHSTVIRFKPLQKYYTSRFLKKYVAISATCKDVIVKELNPPESKIEIIYNGIDLTKFRCIGRQARPEVKNILILGRLAPEKDHANMFKAFRALCDKLKSEKRPVPTLNVVGDGPIRASLENIVDELDLKDNVIVHGVLTDIPKVLLENDLLVMSSKWEGMSIALIEAAASGIPIIATDVGSNKEIIRDGFNGCIVEKENSTALAYAMYELATNYAKRAAYSANSPAAADKYDIKLTAELYNKMYQEAIS